LSEGGLAVAAAEMTLASNYGAELELRKIPTETLKRNDFALFSESNSRFLVEVTKKDRKSFESLMKGGACAQIGIVTKTPRLTIRGLKGTVAIDVSVADLRESWKSTLSSEA
jgi:phosphoribosylformylglycinamidine synthase